MARAIRLLGMALLALVLGGCSFSRANPEIQRHILDVERPGPPGQPACDCSLRVDRFLVSSAFESKRFVYARNEKVLEEDFYNEFFLPPNQLVRELTARWIFAAGLVPRFLPPQATVRPDLVVSGLLRGLFIDAQTGEAVMELTLAVLEGTSRSILKQKDYDIRVRVTESGPKGLVRAWAEALRSILEPFESDFRTFLGEWEAERVAAEQAAQAPAPGS